METAHTAQLSVKELHNAAIAWSGYLPSKISKFGTHYYDSDEYIEFDGGMRLLFGRLSVMILKIMILRVLNFDNAAL